MSSQDGLLPAVAPQGQHCKTVVVLTDGPGVGQEVVMGYRIGLPNTGRRRLPRELGENSLLGTVPILGICAPFSVITTVLINIQQMIPRF